MVGTVQVNNVWMNRGNITVTSSGRQEVKISNEEFFQTTQIFPDSKETIKPIKLFLVRDSHAARA